MNIRRILTFFTLAPLMISCGTPQMSGLEPGQSDVAASWDKALIYAPAVSSTLNPATAEKLKPAPVVIYLHGCSGITSHNDIPWAAFIRDLGYIVVQPDSLSRRDHRRSCDPATARGNLFPGIWRMRLEELSYAFEKLQHASWADKNNIFLMGHSEGAVTAARSYIPGLKGVVVSSWTCTDKTPSFNGLFVPRQVPVLTMGWDRDPWFYGSSSQGSCATKFDDRKNAKHLAFSGAEHSTYQQREARDAVEAFLRMHTSR